VEDIATAFSRGHAIYFDGKNWKYLDNNQIVYEERPCKRCGQTPTKEGYDACLGHIKGATSACCGHGVGKGYVVLKNKEVKEMIDDKLSKNELLELLRTGRLTNQIDDKRIGTIGCRLEDMDEKDLKEAVIEFVYSR